MLADLVNALGLFVTGFGAVYFARLAFRLYRGEFDVG